jgi:hypothetical protein
MDTSDRLRRAILSSLLASIGVGAPAGRAWAAPPAAPDDTCVEALHGAQELRTAGRLSAARARLSGCTAEGCKATSRSQCAEQAAEIDAAMPAVVLVVKDGVGHDLRGVQVRMDGQPLVDGVEGRPVSVDPGEHHLLFEVAGFNPIETTVVAREGQRKLRVLVFLSPASAVTAAANGEASIDLPMPAASPGNTEPQAARPRWRKQVGGALLGAGAGAVVVGTVWSLLAKLEYNHALITECGGSANSCSPQGIADGHTAHDKALVATVAFVGAAALLGAAATVYFAWPTTQDRIAVAPTVSRNGAGVALRW